MKLFFLFYNGNVSICGIKSLLSSHFMAGEKMETVHPNLEHKDPRCCKTVSTLWFGIVSFVCLLSYVVMEGEDYAPETWLGVGGGT